MSVECLESRIALDVGNELVRWFDGMVAHATPIPDEVRQYHERALALGGDSWHAPVATGALHPLTDLPALSSLPNAPATLYLDFNGHVDAQWGTESFVTTPVFDQDGDPTTFTDSELDTIENIAKSVAEDYAPFNLNVSTVPPASFANGMSLRVAIGGDGSWLDASDGEGYGGIGFIDSFTNSIVNTVYVFSKNLANGQVKFTADAVSHEAGHGLGLNHQATYSANRSLAAEYNPGTGDGRAPLMGDSYNAPRSVWIQGPTSESSDDIQDDLAVIAGSRNGFGLRPDDHGDTAATASSVVVNRSTISASGVLVTTTDRDVFAFHTDAGTVTLSVNVLATYANLDAKLELRDAAGTTLIAAADPANSLNATITTTLAAGDYRAVVASHGLYGDVGQYTLTGTVVGSGLVNPSTILVAPDKLRTTSLQSHSVAIRWNDHSSNESGFRVERSSNRGRTWATLATVDAGQTSLIDTSVAARTQYAYRVRAINDQGSSTTSNIVAVSTPSVVATTPAAVVAAPLAKQNAAEAANAFVETSPTAARPAKSVTGDTTWVITPPASRMRSAFSLMSARTYERAVDQLMQSGLKWG